VPACGNGRARAEHPRARRSPLEVGVYPRARRSPLEVSVHPRTGRSPLEGGACPRARRSLLEGTFEWAALVGRGGRRSVGRAPCVRFKQDVFSFGFFAGFKRDFPSCFRGPSGLSPTSVVVAESQESSSSQTVVRTLPKNQIVVHLEQSSRTVSDTEAPALQRFRARRSTRRRPSTISRVWFVFQPD
jgi:hypothetical protein